MEQRLIVRVFLVLVLSRGSELVELERFCYYSWFFIFFDDSEPKKIVILCIRKC